MNSIPAFRPITAFRILPPFFSWERTPFPSTDVGLHYNLPEPAIICTHCRYALQVDDISRHLRKNHDVLKSTRRHLNSLIRSLHLPNPDLLPARADGSTPHPHLALQVGAACKYCDLRSTSLEVLSRHLKKAHECEIRRAGSKRKYWLRDHIEERLTFQSWTAKDILRSWIVSTSDRQPERGSVNSGLLPQETSDPVKNFAQQLFTEERERLEKQSGVRRPFDGSAPTPSLMTNWMRRAGWHDLFSGACRKILVTLSEMPWTTGRPVWLGVYDGEVLHSPVGDERRLALIMAALDRLFDRCGETVRCTDVCVRRWLRGKFPDRPYKAPFELVIRPASERAYRKELKRCLCLWLRLLQLPPSTARPYLAGRAINRPRRYGSVIRKG
ncbi:hypothetical protein EDB81DRAFT_848972 [Dactylonectria macrodidyma]|uniref:C2H2-type domain-containing protein n=1 Tax=Dactylonectria macrodidyma TaxID=307937 RepID=A0A9P9I956_9HYPO|nr:hypothetical protein EDB81DRAFT_848972 [Dactylonectria macrodidyma]